MVHYLQSLLVVRVQIFFSLSPKKERKEGSIQFCDTFHYYLYICCILKLLWTIQHVPLVFFFSSKQEKKGFFFSPKRAKKFLKTKHNYKQV